jgi:hypothetical protein
MCLLLWSSAYSARNLMPSHKPKAERREKEGGAEVERKEE